MNIKKTILFMLFIIVFFQNTIIASMFPNSYQYSISKTELKTRNANQYSMPFVDAQMFVPQQDHECQDIIGCIIWQGGYSFDQKHNQFGAAFSINRKTHMSISGDAIPDKIQSRDIRAEFIGGNANTDASMTLLGDQYFNSARIFIQFPLEKLTKNCYLHNWFFSIRSSITQLTQKLTMELIGTPYDSITSMYNFFKNITPNGKIDNCQKTNTDIENITFTLDGIYLNKNKTLQLYYYSGIEIPTNLTYDTSYLFYPFVGNNGNLGILLGVDLRKYFYSNNMHEMGFLCEFEDHYILYKTMNRVFDLFQQNDQYYGKNAINSINKPWSRYLPTYNFNYHNEENIAVNATSNLPVRVHECNNCDLSLGFIYHYTKCQIEYYFSLGYNLWMAQPEYIELQDRIYPQEYHTFYNQGIAGSTSQTTSSQSTINRLAPNDTDLTHFTINDLDYGSAASDGSYAQGAFFRITALQKNSWNILAGGWFELGKHKMAPSRYGFWTGIGYEF